MESRDFSTVAHLTASIKVFHKHQGFQDVGTSAACRLNADQGIRVKVWGDLSLNVQYNIRYNSKPAAGRQAFDTTFLFSMGYERPPSARTSLACTIMAPYVLVGNS